MCALEDWVNVFDCLSQGSNIHNIDGYGKTPLHWVTDNLSSHTALDVLDKMLECGLGPENIGKDWNRIIHNNLKENKQSKARVEHLREKILFIKYKYDGLGSNEILSGGNHFLGLTMCRSGLMANSSLLSYTFKPILEDYTDHKLTCTAVKRAVHILAAVCPTSMRWQFKDTTIEMLHGKDDEELISSVELSLDVPTLTTLCVTSTRNYLCGFKTHQSLFTKLQYLREHLPCKLVGILCLDHVFCGSWFVRDFDHSYRYVMDGHTDGKQRDLENKTTVSMESDISRSDNNREPDEEYTDIQGDIKDTLYLISRACPKRQSPQTLTKAETRDFTSTITNLSNSIAVSSDGFDGIPALIHKLIEGMLNRVLPNRSWSMKRFGSTALGLKILEWDEVDYSLELIPEVLNLSLVDVDNSVELHVKSNPQSIFSDIKTYLCESLNNVLGDDLQSGVVTLGNVYSHQTAPAVCVPVSWRCPDNHKHSVSIDLVPTIIYRHIKLGDIWTPPAYFKEPFLEKLGEKLRNCVPAFVPQRFGHPKTDSQDVSIWKLSYKFGDELVQSHLNHASNMGTKHVCRVLKLFRDAFFPKVLRYVPTKDGRFSQTIPRNLISSYAIQQTILSEYVKHPELVDWCDSQLRARIVAIVQRLKLDCVNDFYTGRKQPIAFVSPVQMRFLRQFIERDVEMVVESILVAHFPSAECVSTRKFDPEKAYVIIKSTSLSVIPCNMSELLTRPELMWEKCLFEATDNIFYYKEPKPYEALKRSPLMCHLLKAFSDNLLSNKLVTTNNACMELETFMSKMDNELMLKEDSTTNYSESDSEDSSSLKTVSTDGTRSCHHERSLSDISLIQHDDLPIHNSIINESMDILKAQHPHVGGLSSCLYKDLLSTNQFGRFVQIMNNTHPPNNEQQWLVLSNLSKEPLVRIYDPLYNSSQSLQHLTLRVKTTIFALMREPRRSCRIQMMTIPQQYKRCECGLLAIASAVSLLAGRDPSQLSYSDTRTLRYHLADCIVRGYFPEFPSEENPCSPSVVEEVVLHLYCNGNEPRILTERLL